MRIITWLVAGAVLIVMGFVLGWWIHDYLPAAYPRSNMYIKSGPTIEQIQILSSLTTLRLNVADALVTELAGKTGSITAVLVVHGNVTLGVDLAQAKFELVDPKLRTAVLVLPAPQVQSTGLDQERTKVVALYESGLWMIVPGEGDTDAAATNMAFLDAERIVAKAAYDPDAIHRSRQQAEQVLGVFFQGMNWKINFQWSG